MNRLIGGMLLVVAACGSSGDTEDAAPPIDAQIDALVCGANADPAAPMVEAPVDGRIDVVGGALVIATSAFYDPDATDAHGGTELEIWSVQGGVSAGRVWHATATGAGAAPLTQITLADGTFDAGSALVAWEDYAIRVRYRDDRGACAKWSEWSGERRFRTDDGSSYVFDPTVVRDIYLDISPTTWDQLNAEAYPPGCVPHSRQYQPATLRFEGQVFDGVGVHLKGGCGSSRDLNGKASFKVNLDWDDPAVAGCPTKRRIGGQKHLTLNNGVQDWSLEHERLGYSLYNQFGVPTPRATSVRVFVNDEYWGVYTHVETVDRRFLERWFGSKDGMLFEGTYWCDLIPENVPPTIDDSYCLSREFKPDPCDAPAPPGADPLDYDLLRQFTEDIDALPVAGFYPQIEALFEFDTFLSQWAVESVISHWDAYEFSIQNNYRVYHDPSTDRWSIIPTGIDQTFAGDQDPWDVYAVLARRCLEEPDCEAAFAARLAEVNDRFETIDMATQATMIFDLISPHVFVDPRKEQDNADYQQAVIDTIDYIGWRPGRIRQILAAHGF